MNKTALTTILVIVFILVLSSCAGSPNEKILTNLEEANYTKAVEIYNNNQSTEVEEDVAVYDAFNNLIGESVEKWSGEAVTFEETQEMLQAFSALNNDELAVKAEVTLDFIILEQEGNLLYTEAESFYTNGKYLKAMKAVLDMNEEYSLYDSARDLYEEAKTAYIMKISYPLSAYEYERNIDNLSTFLKLYSDDELVKEKQRLEDELNVCKKTIKIIDRAEDYYEKGKYRKAFETLSEGIEQYPNDRHLEEAVNELSNLYIINIAKKVKPLVEEENYKDALEIVEMAQSVYACDAFDELEDSIRDEKNMFHRISSAIVDKCTVFATGWKAEVLEVKNEGAGAYVEKSGEKLLLGNFSDEEVTILSTAGNLGIALAGWDFPMDARDLVYDVQHWGEEEYFVIHLATDAIALVPVIGAVKYAKWLKKANMTDDLAQAALKTSGKITDPAKSITKHYNYVRTTNQHLKNKRHPKSGVKFIEKKVEYSDGTKIRPVVPKFDYVVEFKLPDQLLKADRSVHNKWLNNKLLNKIEMDDKYRAKFTADQIVDIENGKTPRGLTWHHSEKEGMVQLVNAKTHKETGHTGGNRLWGADSVKE